MLDCNCRRLERSKERNKCEREESFQDEDQKGITKDEQGILNVEENAQRSLFSLHVSAISLHAYAFLCNRLRCHFIFVFLVLLSEDDIDFTQY